MQTRSRTRDLVLSIAALALLIGLAVRYFRKPAVNVHDPNVRRIDAFAIQEGEFGVAVRVRFGATPIVGAEVWADPQYFDEDEESEPPPLRRDTTDQTGLVSVPVRKNAAGRIHLFARDSAGHVGGAILDTEAVLAAPDIVLRETSPREGQILGTDDRPVPGARLVVKSFSDEIPSAGVEIPEPLLKDYTAVTDSDGNFRLLGLPEGASCKINFDAPGHGRGSIWLPGSADAVIRLAPSGGLRLRLEGGSALGLRCRIIAALPSFAFQTIQVDGSTSFRHDGSATSLFGNVVPGKYQVRLEGTVDSAILPLKAMDAEVVSGRTTEVVIPLGSAGVVTGRVIDAESGNGIADARIAVHEDQEDTPTGYVGGLVRTNAEGRFRAFVPGNRPIHVRLDAGPEEFALSRLAVGLGGGQRLRAAPGETVRAADFKLRRRVSLEGVVTSGEEPVSRAIVDVRWDTQQQRNPVTVRTDSAGRFHIANAPPGHPVVIRVRSGEKVNAKLAFSRKAVGEPLAVSVSEKNAFRISGSVVDTEGKPVPRAKIVITGEADLPENISRIVLLPGGEEDEDADEKKPGRLFSHRTFARMEIEAIFTDADGNFTSGPLWPASRYTLSASSDGLLTRQWTNVRGEPGKVHQAGTLKLGGKNAVVVGRVIDSSGKALPGVTVLNVGDGPKRLSATTDADGRFRLAGLYDGPAVVVAHKAGYRIAYTIARPAEEEAVISLRSVNEPPAPFEPFNEAHRQAVADLIARLKKLAGDAPKKGPTPKPPDPWALARKDLDAYLAKVGKQGSTSGYTLIPLARELAKEDRSKALRVLKAAAEGARKAKAPASPLPGGFGMPDMSSYMRLHGLVAVAKTADDLGFRDEASAWLTETEALVRKMPEAQRAEALGQLAVAWVTIDSARTKKLLAERPAGSLSFRDDMQVAEIVKRLARRDLEKALPWVDRFTGGPGSPEGWVRGDMAVRLVKKDRERALRILGGIRDDLARAIAWTRLAGMVFKMDPKTAHAWVARAAQTLLTAPQRKPFESGERLGGAVYLLCLASRMGYPDMASLIAVTMAAREPIPEGSQVEQMHQLALLRLAISVGCVDPAAGRSLLEIVPRPQKDAADEEGTEWTWQIAQAMCNPARAGADLTGEGSKETARMMLRLLERRTRVLQELDLLRRMWWERQPDELEP